MGWQRWRRVTNNIRSLRMMGRRAYQIAATLLYFAGGARLWMFGLFAIDVRIKEQGAERCSGTSCVFSSGDRTNEKRRSSPVERTAFEDVKLIDIYMFHTASNIILISAPYWSVCLFFYCSPFSLFLFLSQLDILPRSL